MQFTDPQENWIQSTVAMHEATSRWDVCNSVGLLHTWCVLNYVYRWLHTCRIAIPWGMYGKGKGIVTWMHHLNLVHVTLKSHSNALRWALSRDVKSLSKIVKFIKSTAPEPLRPLRLSLTSVPHHRGSRWSRRNALWCHGRVAGKGEGERMTDRASNLKRSRRFYWIHKPVC